MTHDELIARVRTRGGELRVTGERLQYRPPGVLTPDELDWLARHQAEVARALSRPNGSPGVVDATALVTSRPLGSAGPDVHAWHCRIDLGSSHVRGVRTDGSAYCATCHPPTLVSRRHLA